MRVPKMQQFKPIASVDALTNLQESRAVRGELSQWSQQPLCRSRIPLRQRPQEMRGENLAVLSAG